MRTLALYAARMAAVASLDIANTLPVDVADEGAAEATLGARGGCWWGMEGLESGEMERCASSRWGGMGGTAGESGAEVGPNTGEKVGEGSEDSQLS